MNLCSFTIKCKFSSPKPLYDISKLSGYKLSGLKKIFDKGIGAYKTNPESVRPSVKSPEQWAYARVNAFLYAVRTGGYRGGKQFDRDLLPSGHPLKT